MNTSPRDLSPERALARQIWRNRIAEMIADNSKSLMHAQVEVVDPLVINQTDTM